MWGSEGNLGLGHIRFEVDSHGTCSDGDQQAVQSQVPSSGEGAGLQRSEVSTQAVTKGLGMDDITQGSCDR